MSQTESVEHIACEDSASLAGSVAEAWLRELAAALPGKPYCVALSGGRIARQFYAAVAGLVKVPDRRFESVHFFWADERCVAPTDPESNYALAHELLFVPLRVPPQRIHRIRGETPPDIAAAEAEAELRRFVPGVQGWPMLDLVFLGMGEDGHVASLFPGESEAAMASRAIYRPVAASKPPPHRITLTYHSLRAARAVWVLISGAGKENALRASLSQAASTPLGRLLAQRSHSATCIYAEKHLFPRKITSPA